MTQMPAAGDSAPAIALPDESGTLHRLAERRGGWTVVYFSADNAGYMADVRFSA